MVLFQACILLGLLLWLTLSRYVAGWSFANPITLGALGALECGVLAQSSWRFQAEERRLRADLLALCRSWRRDYGVFAKVRKTRGDIAAIGDGKQASTYYCLVLERVGPRGDADTVSVSTFADSDSEVDAEV